MFKCTKLVVVYFLFYILSCAGGVKDCGFFLPLPTVIDVLFLGLLVNWIALKLGLMVFLWVVRIFYSPSFWD